MTLDEAFRSTAFFVHPAPAAGLAAELGLCIGEPSPAWDAVLARRGARTWASITAYNPAAQACTPAENEAAQAALEADLRTAGRSFLAGEGRGAPDGLALWAPEPCVFVFDVTRDEAAAIGRAYRQVAVVWGEAGGAPALVYCAPLFVQVEAEIRAIVDRPCKLMGQWESYYYHNKATPVERAFHRVANDARIHALIAALRASAADGSLATAVLACARRRHVTNVPALLTTRWAFDQWDLTLTVTAPGAPQRAVGCDLRAMVRYQERSVAHLVDVAAAMVVAGL